MKRYFSLLIAFAAVLAVNAQIYSYESTAVKHQIEKSTSETTWYVRAGLSSMSADVDDADSKLGYDISVGFHRPFTNAGFYWGMELALASQGCSIDNTYKFENFYRGCEDEYMGHLIRFSPVTVGYKYDINVLGGITLDAHLGAFVSYTYGHTYDCSEGDELDDEWFDFHSRSLDYGLRSGIGVWWKKFNFDVSYQSGFNDNLTEGEGCFDALTFSLGYAF